MLSFKYDVLNARAFIGVVGTNGDSDFVILPTGKSRQMYSSTLRHKLLSVVFTTSDYGNTWIELCQLCRPVWAGMRIGS